MPEIGRIAQGFTVSAVFISYPIVAHYTAGSLAWFYFMQHAGTNTALGWIFGRSLFGGREPLCSCFAAKVHGALTPDVLIYTRQVTVAWTIFFVTMVSLSTLLFVLAPLEIWSMFANFLTPVLVLLMFVTEYVVRLRVLPSMPHAKMLDSLKAFWNPALYQRSR